MNFEGNLSLGKTLISLKAMETTTSKEEGGVPNGAKQIGRKGKTTLIEEF